MFRLQTFVLEDKYDLTGIPISPILDNLFILAYFMKAWYIPISVFAVVAVAVLVVSSGGNSVIINSAYAKYTPNIQTQANSNDCDNGATCAIANPLIQGDGSNNVATNTQNPELNEEGEGNLGSSEQTTGRDIGTPPFLAACEECFRLGGEFIFQSKLQEQAFFDAFNEECRCGFRPGVGDKYNR
jgi:hypothetical protein